jgi:hypothetical protein
MNSAIQSYVLKDLLDEDRVRVVKRSLYFGEYRVAVHLGPTVSNWTMYGVLLKEITDCLSGYDHRIVSSIKALYFNIYTNDPDLLLELQAKGDSLEFTSIDMVDPSCWEMKQPRPKNRGPYYHKYSYRIRVSDAAKLTPDPLVGLMHGDWLCAKNFFYCQEVRDILMFKLLHADIITDVSERS